MIILLLAIGLTFFSSSLFADDSLDPVRLFSKEKYSLNLHMHVLEDTTNSLTIDQIASPEYADKFKAKDQSTLSLGISRSTFWLKFKLIYPEAYPNKKNSQQWFLEAGNPGLDVAELFIPEVNGIYDVRLSDMGSSYKNREITHVNSVFPLEMLIGQEKVFL